MTKPARLSYVSGEFVHRSGRLPIESFGLGADESAKPYVAEIHQLAILHVSKIWRVGEYGVQALLLQLQVRRTMATNGYRARTSAIKALSDPLAVDRNKTPAAVLGPDLERPLAIFLRLLIFIHYVRPTAGANARAVGRGNSQQV